MTKMTPVGSVIEFNKNFVNREKEVTVKSFGGGENTKELSRYEEIVH